MQTFLPFADFNKSAAMLDNKRLNKQLLEGFQVYKILATNKRKGGWVNHPITRAWRNYDMAFYTYLVAIRDECDKRGIKWDKNWSAIEQLHENNWHRGDNVVMPPWIGDERIHQSHRYNLYNKDPEWYHMFVNESPVSCCERCSYVWPSHYLMYNHELMEMSYA